MSLLELFPNEREYEGWKFFQQKSANFSIMEDLNSFGILNVDEEYLAEEESKKNDRDSN